MHTQQPTLLTKVYGDMGEDHQEGPPTSIRKLQSSLKRQTELNRTDTSILCFSKERPFAAEISTKHLVETDLPFNAITPIQMRESFRMMKHSRHRTLSSPRKVL